MLKEPWPVTLKEIEPPDVHDSKTKTVLGNSVTLCKSAIRICLRNNPEKISKVKTLMKKSIFFLREAGLICSWNLVVCQFR